MREPHLRVVLAGAHLLFMQGLQRLVEGDARVVGLVGSGRDLLAAVEREGPDVVVCDGDLRDPDCLESTRRVVACRPATGVVILGGHDDASHVKSALSAGARGYVVKEAHGDELLSAIGHVARGRCYLSPAVLENLLSAIGWGRHGGAVLPAAESPGRLQGEAAPHLTPRQREVLRLVAAGHGNRQIADALNVTQATVRTHLSHLYAALELHNRVELALYAVWAGLAELQPARSGSTPAP